MISKRIEKMISNILDDFGITKLPVPVEEIAKKRGLEIKAYDLGVNVSGVLVMEAGKGTIGFNPNESKVRQRFTIAHELGHYEMHKQDNGFFIDKEFQVLYRDENSSTGELKKEQEANAFAAALLMPEKFVLKEIKNHSLDLSDENSMKELAKRFNVSVPALTYRIVNLNLLENT